MLVTRQRLSLSLRDLQISLVTWGIHFKREPRGFSERSWKCRPQQLSLADSVKVKPRSHHFKGRKLSREKLSRVREYLAKSRKFTPAKNLKRGYSRRFNLAKNSICYPRDFFKSELSRKILEPKLFLTQIFFILIILKDIKWCHFTVYFCIQKCFLQCFCQFWLAR